MALTFAAGSFLWATLGAAQDHDPGATRSLTIMTTLTCPHANRVCQRSIYSPDAVASLRKPVAQTTSALLPQTVRPYGATTQPPAQSTRDLPDMQFNGYDSFAERLRDLRSLPVMTLWQSRRTQVYLGVDKKGMAGLHFCQRRDAVDRRVLWHSAADAARRAAIDEPVARLRSVAP